MASLELDDRGLITACPNCGQKNRLPFDRLSQQVRCGKCKQPLSAPATPLEIGSTADFDRVVAKASTPVVVDFWAPWCGPCRMVAPELEKVARKNAGRYLIVKVNTDALPELMERYAIRSIPTLAVFAGGRQMASAAGARPAPDIEAFIEQNLVAAER